ncbi:MAG TPA: carboxymuconolactone decarboxylase family protein [Gemmatimonadaceae bacterium]|nr:carboxymuconolactone decarboxylase family protein [Gemmatimonadaceae bacterium]
MTVIDSDRDMIDGAVDVPTYELVRIAIIIAVGRALDVRAAITRALERGTDPRWIEELMLQSYLFVGMPRALNAAREWRHVSPSPAPAADEGTDYGHAGEWKTRGERTCAAVYGEWYERLRTNISQLHPALDAWMIIDGYGKVLSRPGLDLRRRELCVVGVCAVTEQDRQLHAHLRGALNVGATPEQVDAVLALAAQWSSEECVEQHARIWARVHGDRGGR